MKTIVLAIDHAVFRRSTSIKSTAPESLGLRQVVDSEEYYHDIGISSVTKHVKQVQSGISLCLGV